MKIPDKYEKYAVLKSLQADDGELALINKYTLEPLTAEQVFTFKAVLGNNETDDRNFMPFSKNALEKLAALYLGKTVIKDHSPSAENQIARVYATEIHTDENKLSGLGEPFTELVAKCYMVRTPENESLISEIKAGIKKEVSTGFAADSLKCSICGSEVGGCKHFRGMEYKGSTCMYIIDSCTEAYELSFVAIPAQPNAGTVKNAVLSEKADTKAVLQARLDESRRKYKV